MRYLFVLLTFLTTIIIENATSLPSESAKKVHVCPKHFMKVGRKCYFFSRKAATWQEAYYHCHDKKSNIAIIETARQDKRIRKILHRPTHAIRERWLGGMYNWKQMKWVWASSGKPLTYQGFSNGNSTENEKWHCIIMDPELDYKWSTRPCIEKKLYICHTKTKIVTKNEKIDDRYLNEIPVPNGEFGKTPSNLREYFRENEKNSTSRFPRQQRRRKQRRRKLDNKTILLQRPKYKNVEMNDKKGNSMNKTDVPLETIKYEIYKEDVQIGNSLYPKPIVEEYSFLRSP